MDLLDYHGALQHRLLQNEQAVAGKKWTGYTMNSKTQLSCWNMNSRQKKEEGKFNINKLF